MKKKMILSDEIIKRLSSLGLENINSERELSVIRYFINESFTKFIGKDQVDADEIDITTASIDGSKRLEIKTIFDDSIYSISVLLTDNVSIICCNSASKSFNIQITNKAIKNDIWIKEFSHIRGYLYEVLLDDLVFKYSNGIVGRKPSFKGSLQCINAKHKNRELFEFTREIPPMPQNESFLKKVIETFRGDGYVNVTTSEDLCDVVEYTDRVFEKLIEKEKDLLNTNNKSLKLESEN